MPTRTIMERLGAGEVLLMDGATGSELALRGVNLSKGATPEKLGAWSVPLSTTQPTSLSPPGVAA